MTSPASCAGDELSSLMMEVDGLEEVAVREEEWSIWVCL